MAKAPITPLGNHVLIKRASPEEVSAGGIVLPETAKDKPKEGSVISVGAGKVCDDGSRTAMQVKKGDRVLFAGYAGNEVSYQGVDYLVMEESEILAVIG